MISLLLLGPFVGLISSFFGVGGGIIVVPALYTLYPGINPQIVIGSSLLMISINSLVNTRNFFKSGLSLNFKISLLVAFGMVIGIFISGAIASSLPASTIKKFFSGVLIFTSFNMLRDFFTKKMLTTPKELPQSVNFEMLKLPIIGLFGGLIAGLTGLGGGVVLVPLLINLVKIKLKDVSFYSNSIMFIGTFSGVLRLFFIHPQFQFPEEILNQFQIGSVNVAISTLLAIGAGLTSHWGVKAIKIIPESYLKISFALMLCFFAVKVFLD